MSRWTSRHAVSHADLFGKDHRHIGEEDWMTCVHCYFGWKVEPGSGRTRSWCHDCKGPVCNRGPAHCRECRYLAKLKFYVAIGAPRARGRWAL